MASGSGYLLVLVKVYMPCLIPRVRDQAYGLVRGLRAYLNNLAASFICIWKGSSGDPVNPHNHPV